MKNIPAGELNLGQIYLDDSGAFALLRRFIGEVAMSDVAIIHDLGWVPKQVYVVSAEGRRMDCWFKVTNGKAVKDTKSMTLQFSDSNAICTLRIE